MHVNSVTKHFRMLKCLRALLQNTLHPSLASCPQKAWLHCRDLILRILVAAVMSGQDGGCGAKSSSSHNGESLTNGSSEDPGKGGMAGVVRDLMPRFVQHMQSCAKEFTEPRKVRMEVRNWILSPSQLHRSPQGHPREVGLCVIFLKMTS